MLFEKSLRHVSMAVQLLDDLYSTVIRDAAVRIEGQRQSPVIKEDGFYVFTDLGGGSFRMLVRRPMYQDFERVFTLPLPTNDRLILDVPGENELVLAVQSVDSETSTIRFQARDVFDPLPAGTPVVSSDLVTALAQPIEGEAVDTATLQSVGTLQQDDIVRLVKPARVVRLRPGPGYPFMGDLRHLTGTVRDAADGQPITGATVELVQVNDLSINAEVVGTTSTNLVTICSMSTGSEKRVIGTERDRHCITTTRGSYAFYFPARADLNVQSVMVRVTANGYQAAESASINLGLHSANHYSFNLLRS